MNRIIVWMLAAIWSASAASLLAEDNSQSARFHLITLDPGHFHAALVQKTMYPDVDALVHVYAPDGEDLRQYLKFIEGFNARTNQPTHWREQVYSGPNFLKKMAADKSGNVVVIAGNNSQKADYILESVRAGVNVLADKPMVIVPADFARLQEAFATATSNHVLLYDIMTERFEITTRLQRELSRHEELFGRLEHGSPGDPAIIMQSVHYFSKIVAGVPLRRPTWFFDTRQQGEGIVDVSTHLVDLIQWEAFPEQALSPGDVHVLSARRWATEITLEQFKQATGADRFPDFLNADVHDGVLQVYANGEFTYRLRDVFARVSTRWDFASPPGSGDTHFSVVRGTKARLVIRQGMQQDFKPVLYVEPAREEDSRMLQENLAKAIHDLQGSYPGIGFTKEGRNWKIVVPDNYNVGHEAHFAQVTENFLQYLRAGRLPAWEIPDMITKYATVMQAYQLSR